MDSRFDIIDAFVDGERVDAAALKRALAEADGRDYFVDTWLLRESVQEEISGDVTVGAPPARASLTRVLMFAAALVVCVVGGYLAGRRVPGNPTTTPEAAPQVMTTPVSVAPGAPAAPAPFPMPAPTRVIQVQFGADAASTSGGGD